MIFGIHVQMQLTPAQVRKLLPAILEDADNDLTVLTRQMFAELYEHLVVLDERIAHYDRQIQQLPRVSSPSCRLEQVRAGSVL